VKLETALSCSYRDFESLSLDEWEAIAAAILLSLETELGIQFAGSKVSLPDPVDVQPGLTFSFQTSPVGDQDMHVGFEGVGGFESDASGTAISVSLLLFADGVRVSSPERDYYEMELHSTTNGDVYWKRLGWQRDEFGEFEAIRKWGQLSQ